MRDSFGKYCLREEGIREMSKMKESVSMKTFFATVVILTVALMTSAYAGEAQTYVKIPAPEDSGGALAPETLKALPLGSIRPAGWLKHHLDLMTEGLVGRLYETSEFLGEDNGWLNAEGKGWEEQPYWLRSFVKLAVLTGNRRCLDVSQKWVDAVIATADTDGWYGPRELKAFKTKDGRVISDIWPHMVMGETLLAWYDHTGDARIPALLTAFARYCNNLDSSQFLRRDAEGGDWHYTVQCDRACDWIPSLHRLYEITGDAAFLKLAERSYIRRRRVWTTFLDSHTVNFAQRFAYETYFSRQSRDPSQRDSAEYWYGLHMRGWGSEHPRGAFAADECTRVGCRDPRYGTESCTWGEFVRAFDILGRLSGDPVYADRAEDVIFNHYPAAYTPDWKRVHYITAPNQISLDAGTDHNYFNRAPQAAYSDKLYRCCRHNAAHALPVFTAGLVCETACGGLAFRMYAPHAGTICTGKEKTSWNLETRYPFRETMRLTLDNAGDRSLWLRVPRWAKGFVVRREGKEILAQTTRAGVWMKIEGPWNTKEFLEITINAEAVYARWPRTHAVTVDRGPLSYSLAVPEIMRECVQPKFSYSADEVAQITFPEDAGGMATRMTEIVPGGEWNYALDLSAKPEFQVRDWSDDCFTASNAPCEIFVKGCKFKEWTLQDHQPAALQESPVYVTTPLERLRFIPLGCARLRLSVLPVASRDEKAARWGKVPETTKRSERPKIFRW